MFSSSFWESDFVSQNGFDTLASRMKEARQTCRDVEDFLKQRAKAEEDYAKALLKIARGERGSDETGSLKASLEVLRQESEMEASVHLTQAQHLADEANKLTEFREKQREERKRHEDTVHKVHKTKVDNYRRMITCKSTYESKMRAAEKSESDHDKIKFGNKPKEIERARKNSQQCRQAATKADDEYQSSISQLEVSRQAWERDHRSACEIFQRLEEERIQYLRNVLWVYSNLGSDVYVKSDQSRENIRLSLEKCDVTNDIMDYVSRKATGSTPLMPIQYTTYGAANHQQNSNTVNGNRTMAQDKDEYCLANYAAIEAPKTFISMYNYTPRTDQEVELRENDRVAVSEKYEDGWWKGTNVRTGKNGLFPANYVKQG